MILKSSDQCIGIIDKCLGYVQIIVTPKPKYWYSFITSICAVVGGVFTVAGIVDGILHSSMKLAKKVELGKQT